MTIISDARANLKDVVTSWSSIQTYTGQKTYYQPSVGGQTYYIGRKLGVPRRVEIVPSKYTGGLMWRMHEPSVGNGGPRTECSFLYEANTVTRIWTWEFIIPENGPDKWQIDSTIFSIVGQLHDYLQPNGGRAPPWSFALIDTTGGIKLTLDIAHDNGTGTSGTGVPAVVVSNNLGIVTPGNKYRVCIQSKASGALNDFCKVWLDNNLAVDYSGYVGFPNSGQNFFKIGTYTYFNTTGASSRTMYYTGVMMGDQNETVSTMNTAFDSVPALALGGRTRVSIAVVGGANAAGGDPSYGVCKTFYGLPASDPILPSLVVAPSVLPSLNDALCIEGYGSYLSNCGIIGVSVSSYTGRCVGAFSNGTSYTAGDAVTPPTPVGVSSYFPLGLKYICTSGGISGSSPTFPVIENEVLVSGSTSWIAEKRMSYDVSGHYYIQGELGFDPLGYLSQLICSVGQYTVDRKIAVFVFGLDNATQEDNNSLNIIKTYLKTANVDMIVSSQTATGQLNFSDVKNVGKNIAAEVVNFIMNK